MKVETGEAPSVISEATRKKTFSKETLHLSELALRTYTDEPMQVVGTFNVKVQYGEQNQKLVLVVVKGNGPSLLGRNWLKYIHLNWHNIFSLTYCSTKPLKKLLDRFEVLFSKELGTIQYEASLHVQPNTCAKFFKPHPVPFAIKGAIEQELHHLERQGIISPVTYSQWASPVVAVPNKDGRFRICGDYKVAVNQVLDVDEYPLRSYLSHWQEERFFKTIFSTSLSPASCRRNIEEIPHNQYSKRPLCLQPTPIWDFITSSRK
jgi:hypothetical protein